MDYVSDAASRAGQLVVSAAQRGITLSDAQIEQFGRYAMVASAVYYVAVSFKDPVPSDAKYAIEAHIPSGFDRSIIASRLAQRYTKPLLETELGIKRLRDALRTETAREGKLKLWSQVLESTLVGIVAAAYTHSLTLALWSVKNTSRVLVFVLRKREAAEARQRTNPHRGLQGKLSAWWHGGTQGLITDTLLRRMAEQVEKQASPFATSGINEDEEEENGTGADAVETASGARSGAYGYADHTATPMREGDRSAGSAAATGHSEATQSARPLPPNAQAFLSREFSVRRILMTAVPRLVACARAAVHDALADLPEAHRLDMTGNVRGATLQHVFRAIATRMEETACVPAWLQRPSPAPHAPSTTSLRIDTLAAAIDEHGEEEEEEEEDEEIIEYPGGSTVMVGPDGRPLPLGRAGSPGRSLLEELGSDPALHHQVTEAERAAEEETARREELARQQTVGFFQELIHHNSFAELVLVAAEEQLAGAFREASDVSSVRGHDAATDSAKLLLVVTSLEACRQRLTDTDFVVKPHLKLFCEELVRSTCSQAASS